MKNQLPPLPEKSFLGDDASYGYDAEDMHAYARAALAQRQGEPVADDAKVVLTALVSAQCNLGPSRPPGSSDPDSDNYAHGAFRWDYYQRAIESARRLCTAPAPAEQPAEPSIGEDVYDQLCDMIAPYVTDREGGLPGSVTESFHVLLDHWKATHARQSKASIDARFDYYCIADIGFRCNFDEKCYIPQVLVEFDPVPANSTSDAKGWKDRDSLVAFLRGQS